MKKKRIGLAILLLLTVIIGSIPVTANEETKRLEDLPPGSIVYDPSWEWEHRTGYQYTGSGDIKPVEWIVVAQNHYTNETTGTVNGNHTTLLTKETIAMYYFDDSTNRGSNYGSNHWGDSGTGNANYGIRKFLNGDSYNGEDTNSYPISFFNNFSKKFQDIVLETTLYMKTWEEDSYTSKDKVFLASENEMGGNYIMSDGRNWGYFTDNNSRKVNGVDSWQRLRTPHFGPDFIRVVLSGGDFGNYFAHNSGYGVRPALNLKSETLVKSVGGNKWEIVYNSPPTINITNSSNAQSINSSGKITINGTVKDDDNDKVTISATIGGKLKSIDITGTSTQKNWALEWTGLELSEGTYKDIVIMAKDDKGNTATKTYTGTILIDKTKPKLNINVENRN